jgi:hypothetical protein
MVLADFSINVEFEVPREVRVVVYDSLKGLRIAATKHENVTKSRRRKQRGQFADTLGICHRFQWFDPEGQPYPQCAIVRLAWPNLGVGIISHELVHAAVWMRELNGDTDLLTCVNDEQFAWVLGELVRQTINTMRAKGVFEAADKLDAA